MDFHYRILNVFAETTFGGNPLCVFENAEGLSTEQMLAIALQFNLSETVFILPSEKASARMRIFTTGYEMPFAGHPSLGTAHVVRDILQTGDALTLECQAGIVAMHAQADVWTLTAPHRGAPITQTCALNKAELAAMLGLYEEDFLDEAMWVNTGTDQLLVPLKNAEAVRRAKPDSSRLELWPVSSLGRKTAYVFAHDNEADKAQCGDVHIQIRSRYFFTKQGSGVSEDPGTGSACANLGGWWIAQRKALPVQIIVSQGEQVDRPSQLYLEVNQAHEIFVGGSVIELGRGHIHLTD